MRSPADCVASGSLRAGARADILHRSDVGSGARATCRQPSARGGCHRHRDAYTTHRVPAVTHAGVHRRSGLSAGSHHPGWIDRQAGADAILQIIFTAPAEPGTYECQWQAVNPDGTSFGDAFYMQIVVGG